MKFRWPHRTDLTLLTALSLASSCAIGADFSLSGYGTLGYAKSNQSFTYQRFIDDGGTLKRDSLAGAQVDAQFDKGFSATLQVKVAPSLSSDQGYDATVAWAFVSYRPANDWLFRAGKLRVPLYLRSENTDIGATFDFARLPTEMYSISPTTDLTGASFRKTWDFAAGELTLDGFWGRASTHQRFYGREDFGKARPQGPNFVAIKLSANAFALTFNRNEDTYRLAYNHAIAKIDGGQPITRSYPLIPIEQVPGVGYYVFQGPAVPTSSSINSTAITLGADVALGAGFRVTGEIARRIVGDTEIGPDARGGYVSLLKRVGKWTPYLTYAFLRSSSGPRNIYNAINQNRVPDFIPGAAQINASQRLGADTILAYDQSSWALGSSYSLTPRSKIKAEFQRAHIGQVSGMVDAPPGGDVRNTNVNVYSLSYSFAF